MPLTENSKYSTKKHLAISPFSTVLDDYFTKIDANTALETHFTGLLTDCETKQTAVNQAYTNADELMSGGGATFSHEKNKNIKIEAYRMAVNTLCILLEQPLLYPEVGSDSSQSVGWRSW